METPAIPVTETMAAETIIKQLNHKFKEKQTVFQAQPNTTEALPINMFPSPSPKKPERSNNPDKKQLKTTEKGNPTAQQNRASRAWRVPTTQKGNPTAQHNRALKAWRVPTTQKGSHCCGEQEIVSTSHLDSPRPFGFFFFFNVIS